MDDGEYRRACDRCHSQKLRCRRGTELHCVRCIKAGVRCVSRPSLRQRKARQPDSQTSLPPSQQAEHAFSAANDPHHRQAWQQSPRSSLLVNDPLGVRASPDHISAGPQLPAPSLPTTGLNFPDNAENISNLFDLELDLGLDLTSLDYQISQACHLGDRLNQTNYFSNGTHSNYRSGSLESHDRRHMSKGADLTARRLPLPEPSPPDSRGSHLPQSPLVVVNDNNLYGLQGHDLHQRRSRNTGSAPSAHHTDYFSQNLAECQALQTHNEDMDLNSGSALWIMELTQINIRLYHHAETMRKLLDTKFDISEASSSSCAVDETFELTRKLSMVLDSVYQHTTQHSDVCNADAGLSSASTPSLNRGSSLNGFSTPTTNSANELLQQDHGSKLLFFSCYTRLVIVYELFFKRLRAIFMEKARNSGVPKNHDLLPMVRIGNFSIQPDTPLHAMLLIDVAEQLVTHIGRTLDRLTPPNYSTDCPSPSADNQAPDTMETTNISLMVLKAVKKRQAELISNMAKLKRLLLQLNPL